VSKELLALKHEISERLASKLTSNGTYIHTYIHTQDRKRDNLNKLKTYPLQALKKVSRRTRAGEVA